MNRFNIQETIKMLDEQNLDIRTVTMGISLLDCCDSNAERSCTKIYGKITYLAEHLVSTSDEIGNKYGIKGVNKRISVTPISLIAGATNEKN